MNETPKHTRKRTTSHQELTPEKNTHRRLPITSDVKGEWVESSCVLGWDTTDAVPLSQESKLRDFDLDPKYGPCCTINRLERWERARSLGLHPPANIRKLILSTGNKESVLDVHLRSIAYSGAFR